MAYRVMKTAVALLFACSLAACGGGESEESKTAEASAAVTAPEGEASAGEEAAAVTVAETNEPSSPRAARSARSGQDVFAAHCSHCHAPGDDHPGTMQLGATRGADFAVLEERDNLTADYVKLIVRNGLNGMPPFKPTTITGEELDALAAYLGGEE